MQAIQANWELGKRGWVVGISHRSPSVLGQADRGASLHLSHSLLRKAGRGGGLTGRG